jgi:hypothetical protein
MPRSQRTCDHRLVRLVQDTGDITIATGVGVPRSTATGWLRRATRDITTVSTYETSSADLRARLARMEARLRRCQALLRVLLAVLRIVQPDFTRLRVPLGADKARLLRAVDRARGVVRLPRLLRLIGLSPSRLAAWRRAAIGCQLDDAPSCPHGTPMPRDRIAGLARPTVHRWRLPGPNPSWCRMARHGASRTRHGSSECSDAEHGRQQRNATGRSTAQLSAGRSPTNSAGDPGIELP